MKINRNKLLTAIAMGAVAASSAPAAAAAYCSPYGSPEDCRPPQAHCNPYTAPENCDPQLIQDVSSENSGDVQSAEIGK